MAYADYDFYRNVYRGQTVGPQEFPALAERATDYLRGMTQGISDRAAGPAQEAVKKAACAVAEALLDQETLRAGAFNKERAVSSETVGDWSRTYRAGGLSATELEYIADRKWEALSLYLGPYPLFAPLFQVRSYPCQHTQEYM